MVLPRTVTEQDGPIREALQSQSSASKDSILFATAGSKGCIRLWSSRKKNPLFSLESLAGSVELAQRSNTGEEEEDDESGCGRERSSSEGGYTGLHFCSSTGQVIAVTYDHNIVFYDSPAFEMKKQVEFL